MAKRTDRREFLRHGALGLASAAALASADVFANASTDKCKPNILLLMSDEHNPAIAGFMGNRIVHTPTMDSLAASGITLENHYCNSPLCAPSRASFTSGKYISRTGVWNNECELPSDDIPSIASHMNAAGYESFLCGKMHYDYSRRYGFTVVGAPSNNNYKTGKGRRESPEDTESKKLSGRFGEFHPGDDGATLKHDRKVTAGALEFMTARTGKEAKPFFLLCGYLAPHFPLIVPQEYYDRYRGKIAMPQIPAGTLESQPVNYKVLRATFGLDHTPDEITLRGRELYYALTEWVDNEMGKVLAALRQHPEVAENTIIIYTSDHGENMGEHGMWWKNCMYEQSAHVPTIISFPKRWKGGQRRALTSSHVDLVKTILELGGATAPDDWNGDSLLPYLDHEKFAWKDSALCEYYATNIASGYVMVRQGPWKYTYHTKIDDQHGEERQLFDLKSDPMEFHNLASDPAQSERVRSMHAYMLRELGGVDPNTTEAKCRASLATGYHRTDIKPKGMVNEGGA